MRTTPTLVDTGPLVSLLSDSQQHHQACVDAFGDLARPLLTCWPVLTEAAYLLRHRHALVTSLLQSAQGGFLQILPLEVEDMAGINTIRSKYKGSAL
jgi:predicted nucleic acid-binding protein